VFLRIAGSNVIRVSKLPYLHFSPVLNKNSHWAYVPLPIFICLESEAPGNPGDLKDITFPQANYLMEFFILKHLKLKQH